MHLPKKTKSSKLATLVSSHGHLHQGTGMISGVIALILSMLTLLGVICFHFPEYTSTPEFRAKYSVLMLRYLMFGIMVVSGGICITNIVLGRVRWLGIYTFIILAITQMLGGSTVPVDDFEQPVHYIGLDFFILDLLGSAVLFILIEKIWPLRKKQPIFRIEWQNDLTHFFFNHLIFGLTILITNRVIHAALGRWQNDSLQAYVEALPFLVALLLTILAVDFMQYWIHRAYHEIPFLWRFHAVHHSAKTMDWLAGSRQHIIELMTTRTLVLTPIFMLGFSERVINAYAIIVGFQAVFNHCNIDVRLGPLRYIFVTPNFHHWHHSRDTEAIDKNYAAHFSFLDYLFGTAVRADRIWPDRYGVVGDYMPTAFFKQLLFPFIGSTADQERPCSKPASYAWSPSDDYISDHFREDTHDSSSES